MREAALGRQHPEVAACLNNLAVLLRTMGRHAEAQAMYERCIAIKEQAMGPTHPQVRSPSIARVAAKVAVQVWRARSASTSSEGPPCLYSAGPWVQQRFIAKSDSK